MIVVSSAHFARFTRNGATIEVNIFSLAAELVHSKNFVQLGQMMRRNVPMFGLSPFPPHQTLIR
jgi:hypothetical protein